MKKPLVSFCLFTYNQEEFIKDALIGAFTQTYSPLEIIVSDDCSSDNTFEIIQTVVSQYKGEHKVIINRNKTNLGIRKHWNKLTLEIAKGTIIVAAAGDDVSLPNRVERSVQLFETYPQAMCINSESQLCDKNLQPLNIRKFDKLDAFPSCLTLKDYFDFQDFIIFSGDSRVIRREVFEMFGPITKGKDEDSVMFVRCLMLGQVCHVRECHVMRRWHGGNVSNVNNTKINISEFTNPIFADIEFALTKGYITQEIAILLQKKISSVSRILLDSYHKRKNKRCYRWIYELPTNYIRRFKNKVFK